MTQNEYNQHVKSYADGIYRFIYHQINDQETARDVVQDAFERLWVNKDKVEAGKVKSYLFTTAYHRMIDIIRKNKRISSMEDVAFVEPMSRVAQPDLHDLLYKGLAQLTEMQKTVLLLRDLEGYDYREIGNITGLTESQVKVYIFRARNFMKKYIGNPTNII